MAVLEILRYPDERLKSVAEPVAEFDQTFQDFIADLEATRQSAPGCVGIAAPQVGRSVRVVLVDVSTKPKITHHGHLALVNPEVTAWDGFTVGREGCLSVPDFTGNVIRAERITVEALDQFGGSVKYEMEGYEARAVQHEIDHLDGLLFLDRLVSRRSDLFRRKKYQKSGGEKG